MPAYLTRIYTNHDCRLTKEQQLEIQGKLIQILEDYNLNEIKVLTPEEEYELPDEKEDSDDDQ